MSPPTHNNGHRWWLTAAAMLAIASTAVLAHVAGDQSPTTASTSTPIGAAAPSNPPPAVPWPPITTPSAPGRTTPNQPSSSDITTGSHVPPPDPLAGPISDTELNTALHQALRSDLPADTELDLVTAATAALLADLTGQHRDRYPDYLPGPVPTQHYTDVHIHASVARSHDGLPVLADVTLIWTGINPAGDTEQRRSSTIQLHLRRGGWYPVGPA